ncbi:uncharacterized protein LOC112590755 isoform X1 [Harpegnathos saltator]|uniref:uncharacterized protein LOC112590755 isoform X1 n=1 Tax=Harpegnathos saltator TaxID=610380 RepID=UPI000DBEED21|nr:uncharacterized protein LOC112590755 isoform X1 [Harpegnathos saltator]
MSEWRVRVGSGNNDRLDYDMRTTTHPYSVHAVALNELANYFGFHDDTSRDDEEYYEYPPSSVDAIDDKVGVPSFTHLSAKTRVLLDEVFGRVNAWRIVQHLTSQLLAMRERSPHVQCRLVNKLLFEISRWRLFTDSFPQKLMMLDQVV